MWQNGVAVRPELRVLAKYPSTPCGCRTTCKGARAATLRGIPSFGHHRDKLGAGYTCSLQAMSCVSRALPDLTALAEIQRNPEQPEPPCKAAACTAAKEHEGVRGKTNLCFPPAAFRHFRRAKVAHQLQGESSSEETATKNRHSSTRCVCYLSLMQFRPPCAG